jgi:peptidoglycan-associated lipoprotein
MRISGYVFAALAPLFILACSHDKPPVTAADVTNVAPNAQGTSSGTQQGSVAMSDDLRKLCDIGNTTDAPKFDFDSAILSPTDRSELDQLARCMTTGPLAGKNVQLVGRADPRGEPEYNMTLGATRAGSVEHYLAALGIAGSRLETTSRGALDAVGHDEAGWAIDRRVDLRLAGR